MDSNIFVFGGLNGEEIYSCLDVLSTDTLEWSQVVAQGEWPSARHSHSMIANGPLLFMFGGYDGKKALDDLYSFHIRTNLWKKERTSGRAPFPRFSHCMFIYNNYLGIVGGCPLRQHYQELSFLNLENNTWVHVKVDSVDRNLWVRSSACVIDDDLLIVGGGTSCYAFGTKFNPPMKINLQLIDFLHGMTSDKENKPPTELQYAVSNISRFNNDLLDASHISCSHIRSEMPVSDDRHCTDEKCFVLQVEKKHAKLAKDILKKFGWLDLSRKVQSSQDDYHVCLPITRSFYLFQQKERHESVETFTDFCLQGLFTKKGFPLDDVSLQTGSSFLLSCGRSVEVNGESCSRKISKAPQKVMKESVSALLKIKGMQPKLLEQLPMRSVQLIYLCEFLTLTFSMWPCSHEYFQC